MPAAPAPVPRPDGGRATVANPGLPPAPIMVRCPRCGRSFERTEHLVQVCPNCGLRAPTAAPTERIMPEGLVGRPRRAWAVFLLTWLLWVVFWPLYLLKIFRQLDKQHGRDHPMVLWALTMVPYAGAIVLAILALIGEAPWWLAPMPLLLTVFFAIPYAWVGLWRLHRSRRARGLNKGIGPFWFIVTTVLTPLAAMGFGVWLVASHASATGPFDFNADFDTDALGKMEAYGAAFWDEADWVANTIALLLFSLSPAIALAVVAASANLLWREIYDEKGEAWPYREGDGEAEPEIPMSP